MSRGREPAARPAFHGGGTSTKRRIALLLAAAAPAACGESTDPVPSTPDSRIPVFSEGASQDSIPDRYIVVVRPGLADPPGPAERQVTAAGGQLHFTGGTYTVTLLRDPVGG